jgi:[ribosomal protein S18]-alanine N-acetyltransferase
MTADSPAPEGKPSRFKYVPLAEEHIPLIMEIEGKCFSEPWRPEDFLKLIQNPDAICLCATARGRVAGYSCCWTLIESAELGSLAVDPEFQGRGIGRKLLERTARACRQRGVIAVFLEVRSSNIRAIELYERNGFCRIGLRRGYYSRPKEDALIMKREL